MSVIWTDGQLIEEDDFRVSPFDRGLCHGLSLFETILAIDGEPQFAEAHLARLSKSAYELTGIGLPFSDKSLIAAMREQLGCNQQLVGRFRIRLTMSFGTGAMNQIHSGNTRVWITSKALDAPVGDIAVTVSHFKIEKGSPLSAHKIGNYAANIIALDHARKRGFQEVLLFSGETLCEAAMANVFLVKNGSLKTPSITSGCLPGITRARVIAGAREMGVHCEEALISRENLAQADAIFLTASTSGIRRVSRLDDRELAEPSVIEVIRKLLRH